MRILKSCCSRSWGGIEMYILKTVIELSRRGHQVSLLCPAGSILEKEAIKNKITVLPVWKSTSGKVTAARRSYGVLKKNKFDVIHTHLSNDLWTIVPALQLSGIRSKLFLSKCMASGVSKKDPLHRLLYSRVDLIIAVSNFIKENVLKTCPVKKEKVVVINDAVSLKEFNPLNCDKNIIKRELGFNDDETVVGMVGRMSPGKGHEELFIAIKTIKAGYSGNLKFLIVGSASYGEEKYEEELHRLVYSYCIPDLIKFTGFQPEVQKYFCAMDMLVFPSHEESFGGTLLEAMAMGLPVIASKSGGVVDIVRENETGIFINPKDPGSLSRAIIELTKNPEMRVKFGKAGRERAEKYFSMDKHISKFEELYGNG